MGLGSARDVSLAQARANAAEARQLLVQGINPLEARRAAEYAARPPAPVIFAEVAREFIASMGPSWRNQKKHRRGWELSLGLRDAARGGEDYAKPLAKVRIDAIGTEDILAVLKPIWGKKHETASRLRARIESVIAFANARGLRNGENPARWRGHLDKLLPAPKTLSKGHHGAMPYAEVATFVGQLRGLHSVSSRALEFAILTAARSGEVRLVTWDEIDVKAALWVVPASRMKGGREHRIPLVPRAIAILTEMRALGSSHYVFCGERAGRPLSDMTLGMALRRLRMDGCTVHGFRSSFRDWAGESTDFAREVAEAALAHRVGDATELAYRRGTALEKRRKLMRAWADYVESEGGTVLQLRAGAGE
jgi:integrase